MALGVVRGIMIEIITTTIIIDNRIGRSVG